MSNSCITIDSRQDVLGYAISLGFRCPNPTSEKRMEANLLDAINYLSSIGFIVTEQEDTFFIEEKEADVD